MIDLSKIKAEELPRKVVSVVVRGVAQEQEIKPLEGEAALQAWAHERGRDNGEATMKRVELALTGGAGLDVVTAARLIELDWKAAAGLAGEVFAFTEEYENALADEIAESKKNLSPDNLTA